MVKKTDRKRARIIRTAQELFVKKGYNHTTITDIATEANIAKGGFYYYFDTKESVLKAVHEEIAKTTVQQLETELAGYGKTPAERLQFFFSRQNVLKERYVPLFAELLKGEAESITILTARSLWQAYEPLLTQLIAACGAPAPSISAHLITALLAELSLEMAKAQGEQSVQEIVSIYNLAITAISQSSLPINVVSDQLKEKIIGGK